MGVSGVGRWWLHLEPKSALDVVCDGQPDVLVIAVEGVHVHREELLQISRHHLHDGPDLDVIVELHLFSVPSSS